jgi:hypothetical protein
VSASLLHNVLVFAICNSMVFANSKENFLVSPGENSAAEERSAHFDTEIFLTLRLN